MCCGLKLNPDWMYCFRGRGIAMFALFLLSMAGSISVNYMYQEITLAPNRPPHTYGTIDRPDRKLKTDLASKSQNGVFNRSISEIREFYLVWHRPETLLEKMMVWMVFFTFYAYNTLLSFSNIFIAVFFKTRGDDLYKSTNCFSFVFNLIFLLMTIATVKESMSSIAAFVLEICITILTMVLLYDVFPIFSFEPDLHTEVRRYLSRNEEVPLEVYNYLRDRGYVRSRANSMVYPDMEPIYPTVDVGDVEREAGSNEDVSERSATDTASTDDVEART